jgi:hypothetical protein
VNNAYDPHVPPPFVDEDPADYEDRVEQERLRQEQLEADPAYHIAFDNATAEQRHNAQFAPPPPMDFISTYADWADVVELPREAHEATAIQLIASILNQRGVTIRNGKFRFPMDMFMALLSASGAGRSTSLEAIDEVLRVADAEIMNLHNGKYADYSLKNLYRDSRWGSPQAMFQDFAKRPDGLMVWGEISEKFAMLNSGPFAQYGAKQWFTDRYDAWKLPDAVTYRSAGKSSDTPPIKFLAPPRLNILAGSSKDWFYNFLSTSDSGGGWLPRWCIIHLPPKSRSVSRPTDAAPELIPVLASWLNDININLRLSGEATMPEAIWQAYDAWYLATERRFESHSNAALAVPYWNRHKGHILKLAVIFTVSMGSGLVVTRAAWERAVAKARELEESIYKILDIGATSIGYEIQRYRDRIRKAGPNGISRRDFTRAFQHDPAKDREDRLKTLLGSGMVHTRICKTDGRTALTYVDADLCDGNCGDHR